MFDSDYWAHEGTVSMSESTRTLKEGEPGIYWVRQHGADDVFVRKWTGRRWELVDNQRVYWTDWSFWLIVSGPLLSESDFMQREDVKRWKQLETLANDYFYAWADDNDSACEDALTAMRDLITPVQSFTPPPKPELRLYKRVNGTAVWWLYAEDDHTLVSLSGQTFGLGEWTELDPTTGQPIGEHA